MHDEVVFPEDKQEAMLDILAEAFKWTFKDAGDFGAIKVKRSDSQLNEVSLALQLSQ